MYVLCAVHVTAGKTGLIRINPPSVAARAIRGVFSPINFGVSPTTFRIAVRSAIARAQLVEGGLDHRAVHLVDIQFIARRADHRNGKTPTEVLAELLQSIE